MPKGTQTREDLKVKVNIQSPIPSSPLYCEKVYGWMKLCIFSFSVLQLVSRHVIKDQENGFIKFGMEHGRLKWGGWEGLGLPTFSVSFLKFEL